MVMAKPTPPNDKEKKPKTTKTKKPAAIKKTAIKSASRASDTTELNEGLETFISIDEPAPTAVINQYLESPVENITELLSDRIPLTLAIYQLWWRWSDFEIIILNPLLPSTPPVLIHPESIPGSQQVEFVYPILDFNNRLVTSKQAELFSAGLSMCKMHYTIEKIIAIMIERLQKEGIDQKTEVHVAFGGHEIAKRKAFESIINLDYNVVVTNFDPGEWGEKYLRIVKERGEPWPSKAPRNTYQRTYDQKQPKPK
jgi:hypothetical protein